MDNGGGVVEHTNTMCAVVAFVFVYLFDDELLLLDGDMFLFFFNDSGGCVSLPLTCFDTNRHDGLA